MKYRSAFCAAWLMICLPGLSQIRVFPEPDDDHQEQRQDWFYEQRRYPLGHIPTGARLAALEALNNIRNRSSAGTPGVGVRKAAGVTTDAVNWRSIGPMPTDGGTRYITAGRVSAVAVDPRDRNVVYIGGAEGGVWKSTDGGQHWIPLTDQEASLASGSIAIDPTNPDTIYVGTGEENFSADSYYGAGILKSTDGGQSWTNLVGPFLRAMVGSLAIHPTNGQIILCTTGGGVWRSSDGAQTWSKVLGNNIPASGTGVMFDPTNGSIAYAALGSIRGNATNGVYRSTDAGLTWAAISGSGANTLPASNTGRIALAIAPSAPTTLYAAIQDASTANFGRVLGMWKTTDSGTNWHQLTGFSPSWCSKQCWYDMTIAVHPQNADVVWAGGFLQQRSTDGGVSWVLPAVIGPNGVETHVDQHALAFSSDGSRLYIGNDGGVYSTQDVTASPVNWTELNDTLSITEFYPGMSVDPADPGMLIAGTQDNGTQQYQQNSNWNNFVGGDGGWTAMDPVPETGYAFGTILLTGVFRADATTFRLAQYGIGMDDLSQFICPLVIDPANPQTLYFASNRVLRTVDSGGRWTAVSPVLPKLSGGTIKTLAVAPADGHVVYAGTSDAQIYVTTNAGVNAVWANRTAGLPPRSVTNIVVDPVDPMTAWATFSGFSIGTDTKGHVFTTSDGGASWRDASGNLPNLPVNDLAIDPDVPGTLYAATDAGVLLSSDNGATWSVLGQGMPRVVVQSLSLHRAARVLRAATHGRSVWEIAIPLPAVSEQPMIASISPNEADVKSGDLTLSVAGSNFTGGTFVRWNGQSRATTFVDSSHLTAAVPASDLTQVGRVSVSAFTPTAGGASSNVVNFSIGPAPVTNGQALVSAANPFGGNALAPLSIAALYGQNLAGRTDQADIAPPLPTTLSGVTIEMAGNVTVPLFFVSEGQVNLQVPSFTVTGPTPMTMQVTQGTLSTTFTVTLQPYSPALFTTNSQGTGQAAAVIAGTGISPAPAGTLPGSRPAKKTEAISLYCTGLGHTLNEPRAGNPSPTSPLATTLAIPTVTVGGIPAMVSFSGLAPGYVGLYQVNVTVPANAPSGASVPVILSIGGYVSNTATIAIE